MSIRQLELELQKYKGLLTLARIKKAQLEQLQPTNLGASLELQLLTKTINELEIQMEGIEEALGMYTAEIPDRGM